MAAVDNLRIRLGDPIRSGFIPASEFTDVDLLLFLNDAIDVVNLDAGKSLSHISVGDDLTSCSPLIICKAMIHALEAKLANLSKHAMLVTMDTTLDRRQAGTTVERRIVKLEAEYVRLLAIQNSGVAVCADSESTELFSE